MEGEREAGTGMTWKGTLEISGGMGPRKGGRRGRRNGPLNAAIAVDLVGQGCLVFMALPRPWEKGVGRAMMESGALA